MRSALILGWTVVFLTCGPVNAMERSLDGDWRIQTLLGVDDLDPSKTEFVVSDDGIAMTIGCNRMRAKPKIEDSKITFGPVASTLRMCPPPLDVTEKSFHKALDTTRSFKIGSKDKSLVFLNEAGETIITMTKKPE